VVIAIAHWNLVGQEHDGHVGESKNRARHARGGETKARALHASRRHDARYRVAGRAAKADFYLVPSESLGSLRPAVAAMGLLGTRHFVDGGTGRVRCDLVVSERGLHCIHSTLSSCPLDDAPTRLFTDAQHNLVSWALNFFGVPLDDFLPGAGP
jgi:hypothetical protein